MQTLMVHVNGFAPPIDKRHDHNWHVHPDDFFLSIPRLQTPARNPDIYFAVRNDRMPEAHRLAVDGLAFGVFLHGIINQTNSRAITLRRYANIIMDAMIATASINDFMIAPANSWTCSLKSRVPFVTDRTSRNRPTFHCSLSNARRSPRATVALASLRPSRS